MLMSHTRLAVYLMYSVVHSSPPLSPSLSYSLSFSLSLSLSLSISLYLSPSLSPFLQAPCSVVFTSNKLLVVVAELNADENEALDIVPVITTSLLEEHQVVAGIVVVTDPGTIPINSRGEK